VKKMAVATEYPVQAARGTTARGGTAPRWPGRHASPALATRVLAACMLVALAGCSLPNPYRTESPPAPVPGPTTRPTPPTGEPPNVPVESAPTPAPTPPPAPVTRTYKLGAAAQSLVTQARSQIARGELDAASTTLDRALRIEPRNPLLWIELGRVRIAQDEPKQAESYARKALSLATGDRRAQANANKLLAEALREQGRNAEARTAERAAGP